MAQSGAHYTELTFHTGEEIPEKVIISNQQMVATEAYHSKFSLQKSEVNDVIPSIMIKLKEGPDSRFPEEKITKNPGNDSFLSQQVAESQRYDFELNETRNPGDNDFVDRKMAETRDPDTNLACQKREGNHAQGNFTNQQIRKAEECDIELHRDTKMNDKKSWLVDSNLSKVNDSGAQSPPKTVEDSSENRCHQRQGKYFYYDTPHYEETGIWIPVSVPPMSESEHEDWSKGFCSNGGYLPEGDAGWNQYIDEEKELTMWDVVVEMLLVARGKVSALASADICNVAWISDNLIEEAWKEMAQTLTEANFSSTQEILEAEPPKWLPDSTASACMLCNVRFHPIMCTRHHCRFCGGIFCSECSKGRSLLPEKFRSSDPQRVCDVCCVRLESVQPYLMDQVSRAAQLPTHDLTDLSTLRSWVNFPWGQSMEYEIYKATNTIRGYNKAGGEFTDLIIVLRSDDAVKTFSGDVHLSVGAGLSAAVGVIGRTAEADVRAGTRGFAACYTYSCSKGAFVGCSLQGNIFTTRTQENSRFYGSQSLNASDILLGSLPRPPAASILYCALGDLYKNF